MDADLYAMMHGVFNHSNTIAKVKKITPLDRSINEEIDRKLNALDFNPTNTSNELESPKIKKAKMKQEIQNLLNFSDVDEKVNLALGICKNESGQFLSKEAYDSLLKNFSEVEESALLITSDQETQQNLKTLLKITDASCESLIRIANGLYQSNRYNECIAVLTLLISLESEVGDYWYRLGIVEQQCHNYELALKAYQTVIALEPSFFEAYIFAADCYLSQNLVSEAKAAYEEAKKLMDQGEADPTRKQLLEQLENMVKERIKSSHS